MVLITAMPSCFHPVVQPLSCVTPTSDPLSSSGMGGEIAPLQSPATDTAAFEAQAI